MCNVGEIDEARYSASAVCYVLIAKFYIVATHLLYTIANLNNTSTNDVRVTWIFVVLAKDIFRRWNLLQM